MLPGEAVQSFGSSCSFCSCFFPFPFAGTSVCGAMWWLGWRKELVLEQTVFFAELICVGSQCGSPNSCRDACASMRRGQHRLGHCFFLLVCISFKWLWQLYSLNFEHQLLCSCYSSAFCLLQIKGAGRSESVVCLFAGWSWRLSFTCIWRNSTTDLGIKDQKRFVFFTLFCMRAPDVGTLRSHVKLLWKLLMLAFR